MPQLEDLTVDYVSLVDRAAVRDPQNKSEPRRFLVWKSEGAKPPGGGSMSEQDQRAALEKAEQERDDALAKVQAAEEAQKKAEDDLAAQLEKAEGSEKGEGDDEDEKGKKPTVKADLPPEVLAQLEKAEEDRKAIEKRAEAAEEIAKSERDLRVEREFVAKAETLKGLPQDPVAFGPVLKSASEKLSKEEFEALESLLKAADEAIRKSDLFKEVGSGSNGGPSDAFSKLQTKAQELRKADPKMTAGQAMQRAMADDPNLQAEYLQQNR